MQQFAGPPLHRSPECDPVANPDEKAERRTGRAQWGLALAAAALIVGAARGRDGRRRAARPRPRRPGVSRAPAGHARRRAGGVRAKVTVRNAGDRRARASALRAAPLAATAKLGRGDRRVAAGTAASPLQPGKRSRTLATVAVPASADARQPGGCWRARMAPRKLRERSERNNCRAEPCAGDHVPGGHRPPTPSSPAARPRRRSPTRATEPRAHRALPSPTATPSPSATPSPTATPAPHAHRSAGAAREVRAAARPATAAPRSSPPTRSSSAGSNPLQTGRRAPATINAAHDGGPARPPSLTSRCGSRSAGVSRTRARPPRAAALTLTRDDGQLRPRRQRRRRRCTLVFEKPRATSRSQRQVDAPWRDFVDRRLDVVMVAYDTRVTRHRPRRGRPVPGRARQRRSPTPTARGSATALFEQGTVRRR